VQRSLSISLLPRTCAPVAATPRWVQERVFSDREQVGKRRGQENVATLYKAATMGPKRRAPVLLPALFTGLRGREILGSLHTASSCLEHHLKTVRLNPKRIHTR